MRNFLIYFTMLTLCVAQIFSGESSGTSAKTTTISAEAQITTMKATARASLEKIDNLFKESTSEEDFKKKTELLSQAINELCATISVDVIEHIKKLQAASQGELSDLDKKINEAKKNLKAEEIEKNIKKAKIVTDDIINTTLQTKINEQITTLKENISRLTRNFEELDKQLTPLSKLNAKTVFAEGEGKVEARYKGFNAAVTKGKGGFETQAEVFFDNIYTLAALLDAVANIRSEYKSDIVLPLSENLEKLAYLKLPNIDKTRVGGTEQQKYLKDRIAQFKQTKETFEKQENQLTSDYLPSAKTIADGLTEK